jgi:hypothetical protein
MVTMANATPVDPKEFVEICDKKLENLDNSEKIVEL